MSVVANSRRKALALATDVPEVEAAARQPQVDLPECITQDPREPAAPEYLAVCARWATEIADSVHCPPECGGHPICKPCLALAVKRGLVRAL